MTTSSRKDATVKSVTILAGTQPKPISRPGYRSIETLDPRDGGLWTLLISPSLVTKCGKKGMADAKDLAFSLMPAMQDPKQIRRVFRGVRDAVGKCQYGCDAECGHPRVSHRGDDGYLCYAVRPTSRHVGRDGTPVSVPMDRILLVFVNDERVIYNFYWEQCSLDGSNLPIDHEERFAEQIY